MNPLRIGVVLLLFLSEPLFAKSPAAFHYLAPDSVRIQAILSGPPAPGSRQNQADIQTVLDCQKTRTALDIARARSEEDLTPAAFSNVIGPWFTPERLPLTFALLNNAADDAHSTAASAKQFWQRQRPPLQDSAIHPAVNVPASASYPSLHATRGVLWGAILAQMAPDLQEQLLARGRQIGQDRIIAGVHFPTDVAAGQKLGGILAARMQSSPAYQQDLAKAEAEFARVRPHLKPAGKPATSPFHSQTISPADRGAGRALLST